MGETSQFTIRKMTPADAADAAALDKKCFGKRDAWRRNAFIYAALDLQSAFFVAEADGKIVACAGAEIRSDSAEIQTVAVDPDYHGRGIGTQIFAKVLNAIKEFGTPLAYLEVRPSNTPAINLYEHFGFRVAADLENFYGNEDALLMMRELC